MTDASEQPITDPRVRRLHNLLFGLVYPAFLGTFIVAMFLKQAPPELLWIATLLCVYLGVQFAEGAEKKDRYLWHTALLHILEVALMAAIFAGIGFLNAEPQARLQLSARCIGMLIALLILLPVIRRVVFFRKQAFHEPQRTFFLAISALAVVAALLALGIFDPLLRILLTGLLIVYCLAVVAAPPPTTDRAAPAQPPANNGVGP